MSDMFRTPPVPRQLRPYQAKIIADLRFRFLAGSKRVVVQLPTGGGKTLTSAKIIESALAKGRRVLFTVPRLSLIDQTVTEFEREGLGPIGVMQANHPRTDASAPVQVASVQTLARREIPDGFGLVIQDEAHERAEIIETLMARWPKTYFVGLSATPWAKGMGLIWQDLIIASTLTEMIDAGYLSKFVAYAPFIPDLTGVKTIAGDYAENGLEKVMSEGGIIASVVKTWLERGENRPTLCFGVNRAHAAEMQRQFEAVGVAAGYCDAYTDSVERALLARRFRAGEIKIVCSVRTLTTGIDWPVSCIIDAAPTKSKILHCQKLGRGLRINPGTEDLVILDHAGNSLRNGLVTDIHHDKLSMAAKGDKEPKPPAEKLPKECANCAALMTGLVCPYCGHVKKIVSGVKEADGELVEVTGKRNPATHDDKQRFWSMALGLDHERGKGGKLAKGLYKGKFDVWPRGLIDRHIMPDQAFRNYAKSRAIAYAKSKDARLELS